MDRSSLGFDLGYVLRDLRVRGQGVGDLASGQRSRILVRPHSAPKAETRGGPRHGPGLSRAEIAA